jgi:hypothetical protein
MRKMILVVSLVILLKPVLPVLEYAVNYEYIATKLCVNKAKPELACNGKCHLMKELAKASESEKPVSNDKKHPVLETTDLFFDTLADFTFSPLPNTSIVALNSVYSNLYTHLDSDSFFHPPSFIS